MVREFKKVCMEESDHKSIYLYTRAWAPVLCGEGDLTLRADKIEPKGQQIVCKTLGAKGKISSVHCWISHTSPRGSVRENPYFLNSASHIFRFRVLTHPSQYQLLSLLHLLRPSCFAIAKWWVINSQLPVYRKAVARAPAPALKNNPWRAGSPYYCMGTVHACALAQ